MSHPGPHNGRDPLDHEKRLLLRFKQDPREFDRIMLAYAPDIAGWLESMTRDAEAAQEMTQQTFVRAFSGFGTFDWRGVSLASYLYRIARNELVRWSAQRKARGGGDYLLDSLAACPSDNPETRAQQQSEAALLQSFLDGLEGDRRQVFDLHYWRGLRVWEVGRVLDLTDSQVKSHLRNGRSELKQAMQRQGA